MRRRRTGGVLRLVFQIDRAPDVDDRCARGVHSLRRESHVDADAAADPVRAPFGAPVGVPPRDEAVLVTAMTVALASAETRYVLENFGMLCRELVRRASDRRRPGRGELDDWKGREHAVVAGTDARRRGARGGAGRRRGRRAATGSDHQREHSRKERHAKDCRAHVSHGAIVTPRRARVDRWRPQR